MNNRSIFSDCHYFSQRASDEAWGITISTSGYQEIPAGIEYPSKAEHPADYCFRKQLGRTLQEYQLVYITQGAGTFISESKPEKNIRTGHLFMVFPHEWHVFTPKVEVGWNAYWVGFKGDYIDNLVAAGFFTKENPVYDVGLHERLIFEFCELMDYSDLKSPTYQQYLAGSVSNILAKVYAINRDRKPKEDHVTGMVTNAKILMRENVLQNTNPEKVAESLNIGYSLFRRIFKEQTGLAPAQYHHKLRVQKAKELLLKPTRTIKEISYMLHFESNDYFSTYFKQKTGYTPTQFRKIAMSNSE